jgi:hypothetical protein
VYGYDFIHLTLFYFSVAAEDLAPMSENDEPASTEGITHDRPLEDKPSSPDTEATEVSDS